MIEALRPMSTSELLDRTFTLYRKNFRLFVGIASLGPLAYLACQVVMVGAVGVPMARSLALGALGALTASLALGFVIGSFVMMIGMAISHAATVKAVAAVHLGRETTIAEAYRALKGRLWRVLGIFLTVFLVVFGGGAVLVFAATLIGGLAIGGGASVGTGFAIAGGVVAIAAVVGAVMLAITLFVRYSLSVQACIVEDLGVTAAMKRSAYLSKGSRGRILTVYSVFVVLGWIVALGVGILAAIAPVLLGPGITSLVITYLAGFVSGCLTGPLATIGMSLVYYDERVRKEAFDLQVMMAGLEPLPAVLPAPAQ